MLGNDGELDPTFLNVKHRLGDVPLCKDKLILMIFGYRFFVTTFARNFLGSNETLPLLLSSKRTRD
jgi:hypothetical protein